LSARRLRALPVLRGELELSLFQAGLVVSMFSLVAAITGCFFGALSDRFGQLRLAIIGLVAASAAGAWGALVHSGEWLIVTRVAEGIGFFMMSVSLPGLIIRLADERTRQTAMGLWGAYLPLGAQGWCCWPVALSSPRSAGAGLWLRSPQHMSCAWRRLSGPRLHTGRRTVLQAQGALQAC
jgi:MFS family permease